MPRNSAMFWKRARQAERGALRRRQRAVMSRPSKRMRPACGPVEAGDGVEQRGLAGAVRADHRGDRARLRPRSRRRRAPSRRRRRASAPRPAAPGWRALRRQGRACRGASAGGWDQGLRGRAGSYPCVEFLLAGNVRSPWLPGHRDFPGRIDPWPPRPTELPPPARPGSRPARARSSARPSATRCCRPRRNCSTSAATTPPRSTTSRSGCMSPSPRSTTT